MVQRSLGLLSALIFTCALAAGCSDDGAAVSDGGRTDGPSSDGLVITGDGHVPDGDVGSGGDGAGDGGECANLCSVGAKQCAQDGWQECITQDSGCTGWGPVTSCPTGEICSGGVCLKNCLNQCTEGSTQCSGNGFVTCELMASGCTDWNPTATPCAKGEVCSGGQCVSSCVNQCTLGAKQCSGTGVQTCEAQSSGCTDWGSQVPCPTGQICSGGQCVANCTNQCSEGATRCSGTNLQSCILMASGCTDWDTPQPCAAGVCINGKCDSGVCVPGEMRCNGTTVETCDSTGVWVVTQVCPQACDMGACTLSVTCTPMAHRCNVDVVEECNPTGTAWLYVRSCPNGCSGGLCVGGCTPGEKRCNGNDVEVCDAAGSSWQVDSSCSTTFCTGGACAELELKLDNTSVTLDGEHVYAGDVVLKNNSNITIGPLGWLRIRAQNISVDATSSIEAPPVGNAPEGKGGSGGTKTCKSSYCSYSGSGTVGGGGGGYGTAGQGDFKSIYNCYSNRYCTISSTGGKAHGAYLSDIAMGSSGGSCSSVNGGGMIDLQAELTMSIAGSLKANGGSSTVGGGTYCAGGSGGGIRLLSEDLTVTGILSADAGEPRGGLGRIKLLHGSKKNIAATTKGVVEESRIPPMDLRSSTHPDPALHYNDNFTTLNLSWTRPFSNLSAYYYDLTAALPTSQSQVPDAQSTYHVSESVSFDAGDVAVGQNYFNIVSVGPMAAFGTLESAFSTRINAKPPKISSSSHPSQSTWYSLPTAVFAWTDPLPAANFTGYYYVFDRYATTIPTKASSKLAVTDKQLMQPNLPAGTIWFLHVLSEDTMGYLTKGASHFKVQVGPEPGKGGISGDISEAGSTPPVLLDGVEVTLNRGLQTTTTASGGQYFFSNTVYAGDYELRATKDGYETFVTQVTVVAGQNTSRNIQMTKSP